MAGFLVVDDDQPLPTRTAAIHFSAFESIVKEAGLEDSLLRPRALSAPFGFVYAPRLERGVESPREFIVPAAMMMHPEVRAWLLSVKPLPNSAEWFRADKAVAWPDGGGQ